MKRQITIFFLIASLSVSFFGLTTHVHEIHYCMHSHSTDFDVQKQYHEDTHDCLTCQHSPKIEHLVLFQTEQIDSVIFSQLPASHSSTNLQNYNLAKSTRAPPLDCLFSLL